MGSSKTLLEVAEKSEYDLETISRNMLYISECVLQGLCYLALKNLRHCDVKGQ